MNLTTMHAEHLACAEPAIAFSRLYKYLTTEPERDRRPSSNDVQRDPRPDLTDRERLGRTLLGIDFETSVA